MLVRALSGGGGGATSLGQKIAVSAGTNNIDCGFIPNKFLMAVSIGATTYVCVYDSSVSTTQFHMYHDYNGTHTDAGMVNIGSGAIISNVGSLSNGKQGFASDFDAPSISTGVGNFCYLACS